MDHICRCRYNQPVIDTTRPAAAATCVRALDRYAQYTHAIPDSIQTAADPPVACEWRHPRCGAAALVEVVAFYEGGKRAGAAAAAAAADRVTIAPRISAGAIPRSQFSALPAAVSTRLLDAAAAAAGCTRARRGGGVAVIAVVDETRFS